MNRKERRKELQVPTLHAKFIYTEKQDLPVRYETKEDGRTTAYVTVEWYASTKVKDSMWDIVKPEGIDLSRFEAGNAPLKAMHGRGALSNVGVILSTKVDYLGLYMKAEARLDITKDKSGRPINEHDYTLYDRLMNRTINGFSVGFNNIQEWWDEELNANVIYSMTLHEVSLVDIPANPLTIVKMLELYKEHQNDLSSDTDMPNTTDNVENEVEETTSETVETPDKEVQEEEKELETTEETESEPQEEEVAWNGDGEDQPENGEAEADKGAKILVKQLGEKDAELVETKQLLQESIGQSEKLMEQNEKLLSIIEKYKEKTKKLEEKVNSYKKLKVKHGLSVNKQQGRGDALSGVLKQLGR